MLTGLRWAMAVMATAVLLAGCGKGGTAAQELTRKADREAQGSTVPEVDPATDKAAAAAAAAATAPRWQPTAAEREELVQLIDTDLRSNPRLTDADRHAFAVQLAADLIELGPGMREEDARNRAIEKATIEKYGTPESIMAKQCEQMRIELAGAQGRINGTSNERMTADERAALPAEIQRLKQRISTACG